jgi:hypothetical protein
MTMTIMIGNDCFLLLYQLGRDGLFCVAAFDRDHVDGGYCRFPR